MTEYLNSILCNIFMEMTSVDCWSAKRPALVLDQELATVLQLLVTISHRSCEAYNDQLSSIDLSHTAHQNQGRFSEVHSTSSSDLADSHSRSLPAPH